MIIPSKLQVLAAQADREVKIRAAHELDRPAVADLEAMESRSLPRGRTLVAELDGAVVAAIAVTDDTVVADPFVPTSNIAALLRMRARQLRAAAKPRPAPRLTLIERLAR